MCTRELYFGRTQQFELLSKICTLNQKFAKGGVYQCITISHYLQMMRACQRPSLTASSEMRSSLVHQPRLMTTRSRPFWTPTPKQSSLSEQACKERNPRQYILCQNITSIVQNFWVHTWYDPSCSNTNTVKLSVCTHSVYYSVIRNALCHNSIYMLHIK